MELHADVRPFRQLHRAVTITLSGLAGVTAAGVPTSTDFASQYNNDMNLLWTVDVLKSGTEVVWTLTGDGTGNQGTQHVYGFTVTAPGSTSGAAQVASSGLGVDGGTPNGLDFTTAVDGPVTATGVDTPEPQTVLLTAGGLLAALTIRLNRRR